jgi:hypothetical protein
MMGKNVVILAQEYIAQEPEVEVELGGMSKETVPDLLVALKLVQKAQQELWAILVGLLEE